MASGGRISDDHSSDQVLVEKWEPVVNYIVDAGQTCSSPKPSALFNIIASRATLLSEALVRYLQPSA